MYEKGEKNRKTYIYYMIIVMLIIVLAVTIYGITGHLHSYDYGVKFPILLLANQILSLVIFAMIFFVYIIKSKKLSKRLHPNSAFLQEVSENINEVFIVINGKNRQAEYIFDNASSLLGIEIEELYNNVEIFLDYCEKEDVVCFNDFFDGIDLKEGIDKQVRYYMPEDKTERIFNISMKYLQHYEKYVLMINDVTEEVKKQELIVEALKSEKAANDTKINFLSNMSQEVRTPLNAIIGRTTIIMHGLQNEKDKQEIQKITQSAKGLLYMMNDILDMAKMANGSFQIMPEEFELDDLIRRIEKYGKEKAQPKQVRLIIEESRNYSGNFIGDILRLEQAIKNILDNAIKYTAEGGTVSVNISETLSDLEGHGHLSVIIEDNGQGMSAEFLKKAFEPFEQESDYDKNQVKMGCGLGLSISQRIINLIGGEIFIESKKNGGTRVKIDIEIPRVKREFISNFNCDEIEENDIYNFSNKKFLFVEDNELNREIETELLKDTGAILECAEDGKVAYDMFVQSPEGYYDVILMDIRMPIWDGYQSTKAIRELDRKDAKKIPIIALTANAFSEDVNKSYECGMDAHVSKPIDIKVLCKVINKLTN